MTPGMDSNPSAWYRINFSTGKDGCPCAEVRVPADSAWFDGHFPGRPVLPGIAQLAMVQDLLSAVAPDPSRIMALRRVRFKQAVLPGTTLTVMVRFPAQGGPREASFRILQEGAVVCSGIAVLETAVTDGV